MKNTKETLEEAAERLYPFSPYSIGRNAINYDENAEERRCFIEGAKWQQEIFCDSEFLQRIRSTQSDAEARRLIRTI